VGDIDRGGVFAALLGTLQLLEADERALIRGFAINKFRGDESLLRPGVEMMEERLGIPCVGVIPMLRDMGLDEEDGVAMEERRTVGRVWDDGGAPDGPVRPLRIGVIALPHMSNFTDFDALAAETAVALAYLERAADARRADLLIVPGSKQTMDDLDWLARAGFVAAIREQRARGGGVIGICGGFQMLGDRIEDPFGIENGGAQRTADGLGLLGVRTVLNREKTTRLITGAACGDGWRETRFRGYEIHVGETFYSAGCKPFSLTPSGPDGAITDDGKVFGTYVHGIFDDDRFRHNLIDAVRLSCGLRPAAQKEFHTARREERIDRWAYHLRRSLKVDLILSWL
jgi:adenosylcobyric acid synthase